MIKRGTATARLFGYLRKHRSALILGLGCILLGNAVGVTGPIVIRNAVNDLLREVTLGKLYRYSGLVIGIALFQGTFLYLQRRIMVGMSRDIEYEIRNDYFAHLLRLEQKFYHEFRTGDLMSRATNDLNAVRMIAGPAIMYLGNTLAVFLFAVPVMVRVHFGLTLLALATTPLVYHATRYFGSRIHERFEEIQNYFATLSARAQENFSGVRVVRAFAQEGPEIKGFRLMNREFVRRNLVLAKLTGMFFPTLHALVGLSFVSVLWYGGTLAARGVINVGEYVQFNLYLGRMIWPMIALGWVVNLVQRGMASMERIDSIMSRPPGIADQDGVASVHSVLPRTGQATPLRPAQETIGGNGDRRGLSPEVAVEDDLWIPEGRIEFRRLNFGYRPGVPVLRDVDLRIETGQTLAIVGKTGAGKTTLVNLIARLIDPSPGQVFIDGSDVREIPLGTLRRAIGFVPQEPFLFSVSVSANIALGVPGAEETEIERAAARAGLLEDIRDFPSAFGTLVGERGITLSGGQKHRTAIARAIIRRPKILILDDALSSVDTQTEERILQHLRHVMKQSTSILISHRISTVKDADRIIVLEDGQIAEEGTHESLLRRGGLYAELYEKQLLEEELVASE